MRSSNFHVHQYCGISRFVGSFQAWKQRIPTRKVGLLSVGRPSFRVQLTIRHHLTSCNNSRIEHSAARAIARENRPFSTQKGVCLAECPTQTRSFHPPKRETSSYTVILEYFPPLNSLIAKMTFPTLKWHSSSLCTGGFPMETFAYFSDND